jgi:glutamate-5-semialdehyde dehydrogenase
MSEATTIGKRSKTAWYGLANLNTSRKNEFLAALHDNLIGEMGFIIAENAKDLEAGRSKGLSSALIDRLALTDQRIRAMAQGVLDIVALPDPVGTVEDMKKLPNGLLVGKMHVPIGSILIIYEARPNVTVDAFALCFKSGNATVLKGGSEALNSNRALIKIIKDTLVQTGIDENVVQFVDTADRGIVNDLLKTSQYIDLVIPRGGESLISFVAQTATMPVIKHYKGVCHVYVDNEADLESALAIAVNAKVQRPGVCNAMETLLVHEDVAKEFLPKAKDALCSCGVTLKGCDRTLSVLLGIEPAIEDDWYTEYLDLILSIKVVGGIDEAIAHINTYGSHHSDAIVTESYAKGLRFLQEVDSSAVYVNASTRFTDGAEFGLGAEIGISTDKIHARGPMGLMELTSAKWIIFGNGQIRP